MANPKILICDDEEGIRESIKMILENDYDLILTGSATHGLECLKNVTDIGLVILDIKMPQMNGLQILEQVQGVSSSTPVIIVTGYKSVETATAAFKLGVKEYIVKPFRPQEIVTAVNKHLKRPSG